MKVNERFILYARRCHRKCEQVLLILAATPLIGFPLLFHPRLFAKEKMGQGIVFYSFISYPCRHGRTRYNLLRAFQGHRLVCTKYGACRVVVSIVKALSGNLSIVQWWCPRQQHCRQRHA